MAKSKEGPTWAYILMFMYDEGMEVFGTEISFSPEGFAEAIDDPNISAGNVRTSFNNMDSLGLLEKVDENTYRLTENGFRVAHQRRRERLQREYEQKRDKRQHEVNRSIALLTLGLLLMGVIQAGMEGAVGANAPLWQINLWLGFGGAVVVTIFILLYQAGLLSPEDKEEQ